jgi:hypothetical protein
MITRTSALEYSVSKLQKNDCEFGIDGETVVRLNDSNTKSSHRGRFIYKAAILSTHDARFFQGDTQPS